jgi:hypothetical protein
VVANAGHSLTQNALVTCGQRLRTQQAADQLCVRDMQSVKCGHVHAFLNLKLLHAVESTRACSNRVLSGQGRGRQFLSALH